MAKGYCCFQCRKDFPNGEGVLCKDFDGYPQIICSGCFIMESIKKIQKEIDAVKSTTSLISLNITELMLTEVVNA